MVTGCEDGMARIYQVVKGEGLDTKPKVCVDTRKIKFALFIVVQPSKILDKMVIAIYNYDHQFCNN